MTHSEAGKGDAQRPTNHKTFAENFDLIFGKKREQDDAKAEDDEFERIQREQGEKK
jgi:uncharacterized protein with von Willebrand factor type A (vWA) domain